MNDCLLSICMSVINPYTCLSEHRTLHMKSYNWILRARVGKKCPWHDVLSWIWTDAWHGPPICLMYDMVLSSVLCPIWSHHLSYAGHGPIICLRHGRLFCHMLNSFTHDTNQWYMQCILSIYDILSIIDVTGVRCDRWSVPIRYSWSLLDVRWWRWLGIVKMTYISHSVMHPLIIKSFLNLFIELLLRMRTCRRLNVIIIAGSIPSLDCGTVLLN